MYNFPVLPIVTSVDAFWKLKAEGVSSMVPTFEEIEVPKNSPLGILISFFAVTGGFGMIWHIFWLGALSLAAIVALIAIFAWDEHDEYALSAATVRATQSKA
jgi:cytochrome o ubiquinol oxidase subunit 1